VQVTHIASDLPRRTLRNEVTLLRDLQIMSCRVYTLLDSVLQVVGMLLLPTDIFLDPEEPRPTFPTRLSFPTVLHSPESLQVSSWLDLRLLLKTGMPLVLQMEVHPTMTALHGLVEV
jgi:hypothetical protein